LNALVELDAACVQLQCLSRAQVAVLDGTGDPEPCLGILPAYGERGEPLGD